MPRSLSAALSVVFLAAVSLVGAEPSAPSADDVVRTLQEDAATPVRLALSPATGAVRFVAFDPGSLPLSGPTPPSKADEFLRRYGAAFGIADPRSELEALAQVVDAVGHTHLTYRQVHRGLPVFAAVLRVHFDRDGHLTSVNGGLAAGVSLTELTPSLSAEEARTRAVVLAAKERGRAAAPPLEALDATLLVFRSGLVRGLPGRDHLAFKVEVSDHAAFAEALILDAGNGALLDRIDRTHDLSRRVHRARYPNLVWREGDPLPYQGGDATTNQEVNRLIVTAGETHALFLNLSGGTYRSFDGNDAVMESVQNAVDLECPNASWDGILTRVCQGMASDDVVAHEWAHAYSDRTHGLVYQWQPGALNEAYSDIFGEVVDLLNGSGTDTPGPARSAVGCSVFAGPGPPMLTVTAPASAAVTHPTGDAVFNPLPPWSVEARVEQVSDGSPPTGDGCGPLLGFTAGRIALVDRGSCLFRDKVQNALDAGAAGVIVVNNQGNGLVTMGGDGPRFPIPSVFVGQSTGGELRAALPDGLTVALVAETAGDLSLRWLIGEDTVSGPFRDMWRPSCLGDPDRVGDGFYACDTGDHGGVHTNSGVPNHAFALLVDGGTFNGETVEAIGLTRSTHIYWRAMRYYQVPTTGFADHADLLEQACRDLTGVPLADLTTGTNAGEVVNPHHCDQVAAAMRAAQMRSAPTQCNFAPLLAPGEPTALGRTLFLEDFETDPAGRWTLSNQGVFPEYRPRDWAWTAALPGRRSGRAMFALDSLEIGDCRPGSDDQSSVMRLDSPVLTLPRGGADPVLVFDHYVATESRYDGGNLKVSVNGGPFILVPSQLFRFNPYNDTLVTSAGGNTCPLAGQPAFTGSDDGSVGGSWGQSQVELGDWVRPGDTVQLRFEFGIDGCNGLDGWYLDDVRLVNRPDARRAGVRFGTAPP